MTDKIETAAKAVSAKYAYVTDRPTAIAIAALTTYGAYAALRDGTVVLLRKSHERNVKKANDIAVAANNPPSEQ
jgi:hypothetical protein